MCIFRDFQWHDISLKYHALLLNESVYKGTYMYAYIERYDSNYHLY